MQLPKAGIKETAFLLYYFLLNSSILTAFTGPTHQIVFLIFHVPCLRRHNLNIKGQTKVFIDMTLYFQTPN